jgi:hypothetical protein
MPKSEHLSFLVVRGTLSAFDDGVAPTLANELGGVASDASSSMIK